MDAKTLLENAKNGAWIFNEESKRVYLAALSLSAAVEGPEEATPETDAVEAQQRLLSEKLLDLSASLERQRNAALRALKAERERSNAAHDVLAERERQKSVEGWTPEHDDTHDCCELAAAAACYAICDDSPNGLRYEGAPVWPGRWLYKNHGYRRNLVKAGALILAEIERIDRAALAAQESGTNSQTVANMAAEVIAAQEGRT